VARSEGKLMSVRVREVMPFLAREKDVARPIPGGDG
jgi:hypothetical protein